MAVYSHGPPVHEIAISASLAVTLTAPTLLEPLVADDELVVVVVVDGDAGDDPPAVTPHLQVGFVFDPQPDRVGAGAGEQVFIFGKFRHRFAVDGQQPRRDFHFVTRGTAVELVLVTGNVFDAETGNGRSVYAT